MLVNPMKCKGFELFAVADFQAVRVWMGTCPPDDFFFRKVTPRVIFPEKRGRENKSCAARAAGIAETLHIPCRFQQSVDRTSRPTFLE